MPPNFDPFYFHLFTKQRNMDSLDLLVSDYYQLSSKYSDFKVFDCLVLSSKYELLIYSKYII